MFPSMSYLEWMHGRPAVATHDLGSSDLRGDRDFEPTVAPEAVEALPDPPAGVSLETLVATEYGVHPEQVLVTAGASHANFLAAATAIDLYENDGEPVGPGDVEPEIEEDEGSSARVLVEKPGYEPLVKSPAGLGATVDRFRRPEPDYALDPDRVAAATIDGTCLVSITNRHNPSGRLADRETLAAVADALVSAEDSPRLLVDEVYAPYTLPDQATDGPFGGPTAAGLDGAVVTNSLTKFLGLGDLRVGWLVADREFVAAARRIAPHLPVVAGPSRALGMRALYAADDLVADQRALLAANADALADFVAARDDVDGEVHDGSTYAFLDPENATGDELVEAAGEAGVLVVPGRFFGEPERVRVSLGRTPDAMRTALDHLAGVLDGFR